MTRWRPVPGFEDRYEISDDGQVKVLAAPGRGRFNEDRILKLGRTTSGYAQVALYPGGGHAPSVRRVHNVMLEAFIGPRPTGLFGRHLDDDRENNTLPNLAWGTRSDNTIDSVRNGSHNNASRTHCIHGHEFAGVNLLTTKRQRVCRACARDRNAAYRARKRAA